jgi:hypothetical protein
MNKTFVVIATSGEKFDKEQDVIYAGLDENKAKEYNVDTHNHTLSLEVWIEGIIIQKFTKNDINKWNLEYDRMKTLEQEINKVDLEKLKKEKELNILKSILENNK